MSGIYFFAETLEQLGGRIDDEVAFHICGKGEVPPDLKASLNRPNVILRGYVEDIESEMRQADIFLMPTPIELGARIRIAYAWSCGVAVISHRANSLGLPEMRSMDNCILADYATAITRLARDPDLRKKIATRGRETYDSQFSNDVTAGKVFAELERIAPQRASR